MEVENLYLAKVNFVVIMDPVIICDFCSNKIYICR